MINIILGQVGLDFTSFSSVTSYMALISGRVYPTLGVEKLLQRGLTVIIISVLAAYLPCHAKPLGANPPKRCIMCEVHYDPTL